MPPRHLKPTLHFNRELDINSIKEFTDHLRRTYIKTKEDQSGMSEAKGSKNIEDTISEPEQRYFGM